MSHSKAFHSEVATNLYSLEWMLALLFTALFLFAFPTEQDGGTRGRRCAIEADMKMKK